MYNIEYNIGKCTVNSHGTHVFIMRLRVHIKSINLIHSTVFTFIMCVLQDESGRLWCFCLGHKAERRLVFNVCEAWFVVQFSGVFWCPDLGGTDDVLLPELLFIRPGQRVTCQRRQAVVRVAGRRRSWKKKVEQEHYYQIFCFHHLHQNTRTRLA